MSTLDCITSQQQYRGTRSISLIAKASLFLRNLHHRSKVAQQRRELREAAEDPDFLNDIGVSYGDAVVEANKSFWED